jgi:hypothetical protein
MDCVLEETKAAVMAENAGRRGHLPRNQHPATPLLFGNGTIPTRQTVGCGGRSKRPRHAFRGGGGALERGDYRPPVAGRPLAQRSLPARRAGDPRARCQERWGSLLRPDRTAGMDK